MPAKRLREQGSNNDWIDDKNAYAKPGLFCHGWVGFDRKTVEAGGFDLANITDVEISFKCEGLLFD